MAFPLPVLTVPLPGAGQTRRIDPAAVRAGFAECIACAHLMSNKIGFQSSLPLARTSFLVERYKVAGPKSVATS